MGAKKSNQDLIQEEEKYCSLLNNLNTPRCASKITEKKGIFRFRSDRFKELFAKKKESRIKFLRYEERPEFLHQLLYLK